MSTPIELNDQESARFGIRAARLSDPAAPLAEVNVAARTHDVQMITTRVNVDDLPRVHLLEADGYRLMDALVYYKRVVCPKPEPVQFPETIGIRHAVQDDADSVGHVARAAFSGYFGHYHADPRLDSRAADAAYVEWAENSIRSMTADTPALLALRAGTICGFMTLRLNHSDEVEIVLNAVHPDARKIGLYALLVRMAIQESAKMGVGRVVVSTQINNYAVQKVWNRQGFELFESLYTFHKWFE